MEENKDLSRGRPGAGVHLARPSLRRFQDARELRCSTDRVVLRSAIHDKDLNNSRLVQNACQRGLDLGGLVQRGDDDRDGLGLKAQGLKVIASDGLWREILQPANVQPCIPKPLPEHQLHAEHRAARLEVLVGVNFDDVKACVTKQAVGLITSSLDYDVLPVRRVRVARE